MRINPFKHSAITIFLFLNVTISPVVAVNIDTSFCSIQIQKVSRSKYFKIVDLSLKWNNDDSLSVESSYNCLFEQIGIQNSKDRNVADDTPSNVYFTYAGRNDENHIIVFDIYYYEYGGICGVIKILSLRDCLRNYIHNSSFCILHSTLKAAPLVRPPRAVPS